MFAFCRRSSMRPASSVPDKLEGLAVTSDRHALLVTDNDGVDENDGETIFLELTAENTATP